MCGVTGCGSSKSTLFPRIRTKTSVSPSHPIPRMRSISTFSWACKSWKRLVICLTTAINPGAFLFFVILAVPFGSLYSMTTPPYFESMRPPANPYSWRPLTVSSAVWMNASMSLLTSCRTSSSDPAQRGSSGPPSLWRALQSALRGSESQAFLFLLTVASAGQLRSARLYRTPQGPLVRNDKPYPAARPSGGRGHEI